MANANKIAQRAERKDMLDIDFNEYNNIATFDNMKAIFSNPYEFAKLYRAANHELKKAFPADLSSTASFAIRSRGIVKVAYSPTITHSNPGDATIEVCISGIRSEGIGPAALQNLLVHLFGVYRWATVGIPSFTVKKDFYSAVVKIKFRADASTMMSGSLKTAFEDRLERLDMEDLERVKSINANMAGLRNELELIQIRANNRRDDETKRLIEYLEK